MNLDCLNQLLKFPNCVTGKRKRDDEDALTLHINSLPEAKVIELCTLVINTILSNNDNSLKTEKYFNILIVSTNKLAASHSLNCRDLVDQAIFSLIPTSFSSNCEETVLNALKYLFKLINPPIHIKNKAFEAKSIMHYCVPHSAKDSGILKGLVLLLSCSCL